MIHRTCLPGHVLLRGKFLLFLTVLLIFAISACQPSRAVVDPTPDLSGKEKLLVVDFQSLAEPDGSHRNIRCPLSGNIFMTGPVPEGALGLMTQNLYTLLQNETRFDVIPQDSARGAKADALDEGKIGADALRRLSEMGRSADADIVVAGHLYRFRQRVGKTFAATVPASVAFDVHFIMADSGRLIWTGYFDETQHALSEDLFQIESFLEREGQWVTAEQMAIGAMKHVLKPFLR